MVAIRFKTGKANCRRVLVEFEDSGFLRICVKCGVQICREKVRDLTLFVTPNNLAGLVDQEDCTARYSEAS